MKTQIAVDASGRVLVCQTMPLEKRYGFWVYNGQPRAGAVAVGAETLISEDREARAHSLLGRCRSPRI